jgi:Lrp/AsnC family leucine-responsive transcriptional regulator
MPKYDLDAIDRRIISALQADGRLANVDLAERVGLSPSPCLRRVKRLEREGYITAYRAVLDRRHVGLGLTVFVGVRLDGHANERAVAFETALVGMSEILACHLVSGETDYLLEVAVADLERYQKFLVEKLLELPMVREVRSTFVISTLKAAGPLPLSDLSPAVDTADRASP